MTVKEAYDVVKKKFNLPSFEEVDAVLDIIGLEHEHSVLREIRHRVHDRLDFAMAIADTVVQPDPNNVRSMMESSYFTNDEKNAAIRLSQHVMVLWRAWTEAELLNEERSDAELLKLIIAEWSGLKSTLLPFVQKMKKSWKSVESHKNDLGYLG
jgi:hypothetical protein